MVALKNISFLTDNKGNKKSVLLQVNDFIRLQDEIDDLEDALALEKARRDATGFKKWRDFVKEISFAEKK